MQCPSLSATIVLLALKTLWCFSKPILITWKMSTPSRPADCKFSDETLQAMHDAIQGRNLSGPFGTTEEMLAAILEEETE